MENPAVATSSPGRATPPPRCAATMHASGNLEASGANQPGAVEWPGARPSLTPKGVAPGRFDAWQEAVSGHAC